MSASERLTAALADRYRIERELKAGAPTPLVPLDSARAEAYGGRAVGVVH